MYHYSRNILPNPDIFFSETVSPTESFEISAPLIPFVDVLKLHKICKFRKILTLEKRSVMWFET